MMVAVHLTRIPCEPNTAHIAHTKPCFWEILPRTNNIVHAGFQDFRAFLCVFMSFGALSIKGKCTSCHLSAYDGLVQLLYYSKP